MRLGAMKDPPGALVGEAAKVKKTQNLLIH